MLSPPTDNRLYNACFLDSLRGWVVGSQGTILRTTSGGLSWQAQNPGITNDIHEIFMLNDRLGWGLAFEYYVDTASWFGTKILRTTNGGNTWTNWEYPESAEFFYSVFFQDSARGWMAGEHGRLMRTTNAGLDWFPAQVDSSPHARWGIVNVKFFTPSHGFAMGGRIDIIGVVWRTTDGGMRWRAEEVSPEPVHDMHMLDSLHLVAIVGDADYGASMIRSRDGGETWEYTFLNIFGLPQALSFRTPKEVWAPLGFEGRLMYSLDTAHTWTTFDIPHRRPVYDLVFTDSLTGYAVGDSGMVLKFRSQTLNVEHSLVLSQVHYALHQNYPNPFNPVTTISFDLPEAGFVTIKVFNILGQELRTLLHQMRGPGRHYVSFDGKGLPGGVYFYRLTSGLFSEVRKMLLLQ